MNIGEVVYQETEILQKLVPFDRIGDVAASLGRIEAAVNERITELEAQRPEVVNPVYNCGDYDCPECEFRSLYRLWKFCPQCGVKLKWEEK